MRFIISVLCILCTLAASAQKLWTLEDVVSYAKENNISIRKAQLNERLSEYSLTQSKLNFLPGINANTGYYFNFGKTIDPTTNLFVNQNTQTNTLQLNGNLGLFNGLQKVNALKQSEYDLEASRASTATTVNNVELYAVGGYLEIIYAAENLRNAVEQMNLSQEQVNRTRILVNSGVLAQGSLYDIEAQAATDEVAKVNAENALNLARLNLSQLLNLSAPIELAVQEVDMPRDIASLSLTVDDIYEMALTTQPQIRAANFQLKSAEKGLSIARGALYPSLSLFGSLSTTYSNVYDRLVFDNTNLIIYEVGYLSTDLTPVINYSPTITQVSVPFDQQYQDNFGQAFGFSLEIPIFSNWQSRTNVSRSKVQALTAQYNLEEAKQTLLKDVQSAFNDAVAARNSYEAALKALTAFQKSEEDARRKFEAGAITSLDFTTASNNFKKAQSDVLQAKYQYIFKLKVLDFYQGKPITLQ